MRMLSVFGLLLISTNLFAFGGDMGGGRIRRVITLDSAIIEAIALKSGAIVTSDQLTELEGVIVDLGSVQIDLSSTDVDSLLLTDGREFSINGRNFGGDGGGGGR